MNAKEKITSFTHLDAWKKGHQLVIGIYRATRAFPKEEVFALTAQIRRAIVSVTSNIAEGFGRTSKRDKLHFYDQAYGSLMEIQNQLLIARDINYLDEKTFNVLAALSVEVAKLINGLRKQHNATFQP